MVIVVTAVGVRKVVEKWLCENMTCELVVSRNARHECCVEVIYDSGNPSVCVLFYALPWVNHRVVLMWYE